MHGLNTVETFGFYSVNLEFQKLIALIGRGLLASCVLVYNGTGRFNSILPFENFVRCGRSQSVRSQLTLLKMKMEGDELSIFL